MTTFSYCELCTLMLVSSQSIWSHGLCRASTNLYQCLYVCASMRQGVVLGAFDVARCCVISCIVFGAVVSGVVACAVLQQSFINVFMSVQACGMVLCLVLLLWPSVA